VHRRDRHGCRLPESHLGDRGEAGLAYLIEIEADQAVVELASLIATLAA